MKTISIRNMDIGSGRPKICAPIVGRIKSEILEQAAKLTELPVDLAEWRADWMDAVFEDQAILDVLAALRECLGDMPLLMTFRTDAEGGEKAVTETAYVHLCTLAIESGLIDLIDVEMMREAEAVEAIVRSAHCHGVKVIMSNHEFHRTPQKDVIVERLKRMEKMGADILKIAVMPTGAKDVLTLLAATEEMASQSEQPLITMSMGGDGVISRLAGEIFGSAVTFGSAGQASAPGQIDAAVLSNILETIHNARS